MGSLVYFLGCLAGKEVLFFFRPFCSQSTTPISYDFTKQTRPEAEAEDRRIMKWPEAKGKTRNEK